MCREFVRDNITFSPEFFAREPSAALQPVSVAHRDRRAEAAGCNQEGCAGTAHRFDRDRGAQAELIYLSGNARNLLKRAGPLCRNVRLGCVTDYQGRRSWPAHRLPLQQPLLWLQLLPDQKHQAAIGQLQRCTANAERRPYRLQPNTQGFCRQIHSQAQAAAGGDLSADHEGRLRQF